MQPVGAYANVFNTITYTYAAAPTRVESTDGRYHKNIALYIVYKYYVKLRRAGT